MEWSAVFKSQFRSSHMCRRNSPGGPVDKTQCFHCEGHEFNYEFDPWLGTKIAHAMWSGQNKRLGRAKEEDKGKGSCCLGNYRHKW